MRHDRFSPVGQPLDKFALIGVSYRRSCSRVSIPVDTFARLDVRAQFLAEDGASIYVYYPSLLELKQKVGEALASGGSTNYRDQYFRTTPRFECGDPRYAWPHQSLFVAEGRIGPGMVEYKVYRVV